MNAWRQPALLLLRFPGPSQNDVGGVRSTGFVLEIDLPGW